MAKISLSLNEPPSQLKLVQILDTYDRKQRVALSKKKSIQMTSQNHKRA